MDRAEDEFQNCKQLIANVALLAHSKPDAKLILQVDASDFAIGGTLSQVIDEQIQPLAFSLENFPKQKGTTAHTTESY